MCLAVPAKIIRCVDEDCVEVDIGGIRRMASIALVPEAREGDYVIIHAGYALTLLDEVEALKTLALFDSFIKDVS